MGEPTRRSKEERRAARDRALLALLAAYQACPSTENYRELSTALGPVLRVVKQKVGGLFQEAEEADAALALALVEVLAAYDLERHRTNIMSRLQRAIFRVLEPHYRREAKHRVYEAPLEGEVEDLPQNRPWVSHSSLRMRPFQWRVSKLLSALDRTLLAGWAEGRTHRELSTSSGLSPCAVRQRLSRARRHLAHGRKGHPRKTSVTPRPKKPDERGKAHTRGAREPSMESSAEKALLHLYGQRVPHEDGWLMGNRKGLLALKAALERALSEESFGEEDVYVSANDGFSLRVLRIEEPETWQRAAVPYHEPGWAEARSNALWPLELAPTRKFPALKGR